MIRLVTAKDLKVLWASPLPYAVAAVFHVTLGFLVVNQLEARRQAVLQPMMPIAGFLLLICVPVLTMRSVAEEARSGTLDLLLTSAIRIPSLVVGKWLACWTTALVVLAPSLVTVAVVAWFGDPDFGPVIAGFAGLALMAALLCGIGVAASSATSSQAVAGLSALFAGLLFWFAHVSSDALVTGAVIGRFSISERLRTFAGGLIDTSDVVFFVVATIGALVVAGATLVARRRS